MVTHSVRFAEESATSKQKNKMQKQTGTHADMGADWLWGRGEGMEEQFCTPENKQIIPSSHSEGMIEEDRGSVAGQSYQLLNVN